MKAWAFGVMDLKLSRAEFWGLTPREYRALADRWTERETLWDLRFGILGSTLASAAGAKRQDGNPLRPDDIYGSLKPAGRSYRRHTGSNIVGARPSAQAEVLDAVADGWLAWAEKANQIADQRGLPKGIVSRGAVRPS